MSEHYHDVGDLRFLKEMVNSRLQNSKPGSPWMRSFAVRTALFHENIASSSHSGLLLRPSFPTASKGT